MIDTLLPFRTGDGVAPGDARETARLLVDGLLVTVLLDVVVAADAPADHDLRARALRLLVPDRLHDRGAAVVQLAAAWYWCGGAPPHQVDLAVLPGRGRVVASSHLVVHERRMTADDVVLVGPPDGPVVVTTGPRTAADVLRTLPEATALAACRQVAGATGATAEEIAACLERMPRARGVARARRLLQRWPEPEPEPEPVPTPLPS